jgi:hypothetical protein
MHDRRLGGKAPPIESPPLRFHAPSPPGIGAFLWASAHPRTHGWPTLNVSPAVMSPLSNPRMNHFTR